MINSGRGEDESSSVILLFKLLSDFGEFTSTLELQKSPKRKIQLITTEAQLNITSYMHEVNV